MCKRVLIPLDGSELSEQALAHLSKLNIAPDDTTIILLQIVEPPITLYASGSSATSTTRELLKSARVDAVNYLAKLARRLEEQGLTVKSVTKVGSPAEIIMDYAADNEVSLIIMSTHGRSGWSRWFHGSVTEKVTRRSRIPVLVAPPVSGKEEPHKS